MSNIEQLKKAAREKLDTTEVPELWAEDTYKVLYLLLDEIVTSTYLQVVNETLETQALALEEMKYPYCQAQWASSDIEGAECDGRNSALQQAADHLRSQKIDK